MTINPAEASAALRSALEPCPFCNGSDIRFDDHGPIGRGPLHAGEHVWSMCCYQCGATFPNMYSKKALLEKWNRRAAPAQPVSEQGEGWKPIESAPKDGTQLIATGWNFDKVGTERHYAIVQWNDCWYAKYEDEALEYLTHWMPLPAAPQTDGGKA